MSRNIGIIVEWDNARLSDVDRAREMLRRLEKQTSEIARRSSDVFDLQLIYDPDEIPAEVPQTVLAECVDESRWPGDVRLIAAPGLSYYAQKNFGVGQTDAEFILFIDSDVVPDDNWLVQLLDALEDPDVKVVGGETYLTTSSFYERLCAAFWNFDVKRGGDGLYETRNFYANNVAFKREILASHPFPEAQSFRGQCSTLAKQLQAIGIKLYRIRSATVSHPPPEGFKHFIHRAVCQGHDALLNDRMKKHGLLRANPFGSLLRFFRGLLRAPARIWSRRRQSSLGPSGIVAALALSMAYSGLMLFGELATFLSPRFVRQNFSI